MSSTGFDKRVQTIWRRTRKVASAPGQRPAPPQNGAGPARYAPEFIGVGRRGRAAVTLVGKGTPRRNTPLLMELLFLLITVGPWVLMTWLLWPRRW
jgi:hypothetical protein